MRGESCKGSGLISTGTQIMQGLADCSRTLTFILNEMTIY